MSDAERLVRFRHMNDLTIKELASKARCGKETIVNVENGTKPLKGALLRYLDSPPHGRDPIVIDPLPPTCFQPPTDDLPPERANLVHERARLVEFVRTMDTRIRTIDTRLRNEE